MLEIIPGFKDMIPFIPSDFKADAMNQNTEVDKGICELVSAINSVDEFVVLESFYCGAERKGAGLVEFLIMDYNYNLGELFLSTIASRFELIATCVIKYQPFSFVDYDDNNQLQNYNMVNLLHRIVIEENENPKLNMYSELVNAVCDFAHEVNQSKKNEKF
jgi:hypothetical protein